MVGHRGEYAQNQDGGNLRPVEKWTRAMRGVEFNAKAQEEERQRENMARRERKIVRYFSSEDIYVINDHDVELSSGEENHVLKCMRSGEINTRKEMVFLELIDDPILRLGGERVFSQIKDSKRYRQIIATFTGKGFDNWQSVTEADMLSFRNHYNTPFRFANDRRAFMGDIRKSNSPQEYEEYAKSMNEFEHIIFGNRQDYYEALMDMHEKASRIDFRSATNDTTARLEARRVEARVMTRVRESEPRKQNMARQERKIVRFFSSNNSAVIDFDDVNLRPSEERLILDQMRDGYINESDERRLLESIKSPVDTDGEDSVFSRIGGMDYYRQIISASTGKGLYGWPSVTKDDMVKFLAKYPTPDLFEEDKNRFMETIRWGTPPELYVLYVESMDKFTHLIFGKRQEYYDALTDMHQKAMGAPRGDGAGRYAVAEAINRPLSVGEMSYGESREILKRARIEGDAMQFGKTNYHLTTGALEQADLAPAYRVQFGDADIALSKRFRANSRDVVIAYVRTEDGNKYAVRAYYRSRSQGVWRFLPDYVPLKDSEGGICGFDWFGKGYGENDMTLPAEMQEAMAMLDERPRAQNRNVNLEFCFFGTAQQYQSRFEHDVQKETRGLRNSVYDEISSRPAIKFTEDPCIFFPPESVGVNRRGQEPDFSRLRREYNMASEIYGKIHVRTFISKDGNLLYSFNEDSNGRVWIGGIELLGKTNSAGLRHSWVEGGNLLTPLYEYDSQDGNYGDRQDRKGNYVCMWRGYLSKIPMIREYKSIFSN